LYTATNLTVSHKVGIFRVVEQLLRSQERHSSTASVLNVSLIVCLICHILPRIYCHRPIFCNLNISVLCNSSTHDKVCVHSFPICEYKACDEIGQDSLTSILSPWHMSSSVPYDRHKKGWVIHIPGFPFHTRTVMQSNQLNWAVTID